MKFFLDVFVGESGYKSFFKGFVAMATLFLVSSLQVSAILIPIEKSSYELKYNFEYSEKKTFDSFEEMKCDVEKKSYKDCKLAKYQNELSKTALNALTLFQDFTKSAAILLLCLSALGFILVPYMGSHVSGAERQNSNTSDI